MLRGAPAHLASFVETAHISSVKDELAAPREANRRGTADSRRGSGDQSALGRFHPLPVTDLANQLLQILYGAQVSQIRSLEVYTKIGAKHHYHR